MRSEERKNLKNIDANGSVHVLGDMARFPLSSRPPRALPRQKSNGSGLLRSSLAYQALLWLIWCAVCVQRGVFLFLSAVSCHHADSRENTLPVSTVNEAVYDPGENSFGLLIFAGSQSRVANETFAKGRTQRALPVVLMLSCSQTENISLSLHRSSSTLPLPL